MVIQKMTAGLANGHNRSRGDFKHAKVARKVLRDKDAPKTMPKNMKTLPHKVYNVKEARYQEVNPHTNPMIKNKVQVDLPSYRDHDVACGMLASF